MSWIRRNFYTMPHWIHRYVVPLGVVILLTPSVFSKPLTAMQSLDQLDRLHTIIVAHHGDIIFEATWDGPGPFVPVNIKSLSKTVLATITGQAIANGVIPSLQSTIGELTPQLIPAHADPRVYDITIEQLLSMQSGLMGTSGDNYGRWIMSQDWISAALTQPVVAEPGSDRIYSTGNSHILSAILTELTGLSTWELTQRWLSQPLNVMLPPWPKDPQGYFFGGNDMMLSPRALLRLGELYRRQGSLDGTALLSPDWIAQAWEPRGSSEWNGDGYGLGWFVTNWQGVPAFYGRGYGGQLLWVIPEQALTIVVTASPNPPSPGYAFVLALTEILQQQLLPELLQDS